MFAGLLNEKIELYEQVKTKNAFGEEVETLELRFTTRAKVSHLSGSRTVQNDEILIPYQKTFVVRDYVPVRSITWIKYRDNFYRILSVDYDKDYRQKICITELVNQ